MSFFIKFLASFLPAEPINWESLAKTLDIEVTPYDGDERVQILNQNFPLHKDDDSFLLIKSFILICDFDERSLRKSKSSPNEIENIKKFFQIINNRIKNHDISGLLMLSMNPRYFMSIQTSNFSYQFAKNYLIIGNDNQCHFDVMFHPSQIM